MTLLLDLLGKKKIKLFILYINLHLNFINVAQETLISVIIIRFFYYIAICLFGSLLSQQSNLTAIDANSWRTLASWSRSNTGVFHPSHWEQTIIVMRPRAFETATSIKKHWQVKSITNDPMTIQHSAVFYHYCRCGTHRHECRLALLLTLNIIIIILSKVNDRTFWSCWWCRRFGGSGSCSLVVLKKTKKGTNMMREVRSVIKGCYGSTPTQCGFG